MNRECERFRKSIMEEAAGELPEAFLPELEKHLETCPICRQERDLLAQLIGQVKALPEEDVPRHFYVYEEAYSSPWAWFREGLNRRRWAVGAVVGVFLLMAGFVVKYLTVTVAPHSIMLSFGEPSLVLADRAEFRQELLDSLYRVIREENDRRFGQLRREWAGVTRTLGRQQQQMIESSLSELHSQINREVQVREELLKSEVEGTALAYYQLLAELHKGDMEQMESRMNQLAASDRLRSGEANAIMATLIQLADNRRRDTQ